MLIDADGNFWFGDEFGPFLIKTDRTGKVLTREIPVPNTLALGGNRLVQTSNNPVSGGRHGQPAQLPLAGKHDHQHFAHPHLHAVRTRAEHRHR
ncbi:hypothetical protein GM676_05145 [Duganella radicis]|uniref:Phytase-like domain-containing protein n=2 Tax=Duganella radicis TaxID=551988 RepID=A0A6L6PEC3_9BURK|nr:hypothetical protein [Duganella radicis]